MQRFGRVGYLLAFFVGVCFGPGCTLLGGETDKGGIVYTVSVEPNDAAQVSQTQEILAARMAKMGTTLGQVVPLENGRLEVLVPGTLLLGDDPGRLFESVAFSVWEVDDAFTAPSSWHQRLIGLDLVAGKAELPQMASALIEADPPIGERHVVWNVPETQGKPVNLLVLRGEPILEAKHILSAEVRITEQGFPVVDVALSEIGATQFEAATKRLVGKKLAIVLNGIVQSAPVIREAISGGRVQISMGAASGIHEAKGLAAILSSKPLPTTLQILDIEQVPPGTRLDVPRP